MTKYTPNYDLDQYEGTDVPNLADQYNNAMDKIDTALHLQAGDVAGVANKISSINQAISGINTEIEGVNSEITGLTAELAALGITDEEGAAALLTTINGHGTAIGELNTVQAQHTQEISDVMGDVAKIEADFIADFSAAQTQSITTPPAGSPLASLDLVITTNANNTILKVFGYFSLRNTGDTTTSVATQKIPGSANRYGLPVGNTPLPANFRNRIFTYAGFRYGYKTPEAVPVQLSTLSFHNFAVGSDGIVYVIASGSANPVNVVGNSVISYVLWQTSYYNNIPVVDNTPDA